MGFAVRQMMRDTTIQMADAYARTMKTVVQLGNLYADRIEAARLRAGNMFADRLIAGDFGICKGMSAKLAEPLQAK
jgi:GMP synthase PP-ATPase subunit